MIKSSMMGEESNFEERSSPHSTIQVVADNPMSKSQVIDPRGYKNNSIHNSDSSFHLEPAISQRGSNFFNKKTLFKPPNFSDSGMPACESSQKLTDLITVMQMPIFKSMPPPMQEAFKELFTYAQKLETVVQDKDEEISRLMFLNRYHFKIQEKKEQMYSKLVQTNRAMAEEGKKLLNNQKSKHDVTSKKREDVIIKRTSSIGVYSSRRNESKRVSLIQTPYKTFSTQISKLTDTSTLVKGINPIRKEKSNTIAGKRLNESKASPQIHSVSLDLLSCWTARDSDLCLMIST